LNPAPAIQRGPELRAAGLTLVELMIYFSILAIVGTTLVMVFIESSRTVVENYAIEQAEQTNRATLFRMAQDLRPAITGTPRIADAGKTLSFVLPLGYNDKGPISGDGISYEIRRDLDAGTSKGRAPSASLIRRNVRTRKSVVLARNLVEEESGFEVPDPGTVAITMANCGWVHRGGVFIERKVSRSIVMNLRN
jgi:hypothetical protein